MYAIGCHFCFPLWIYQSLVQQTAQDVGKFNFAYDWYDQMNQTAVRTHLPFMICPSAPDPYRMINITGGKLAAAGDYGYTPNMQSSAWSDGLMTKPPASSGALDICTDPAQPRGYTQTDISDGLSNTFLIMEMAGRPEFYTSRGRQSGASTWHCGNEQVGPTGVEYALDERGIEDGAWADDHNFSPVHTMLPDASECPGPAALNATNCRECFAFHPGGMNALFCDGSVHFIQKSITVDVFAALVTRADGDIVPGRVI